MLIEKELTKSIIDASIEAHEAQLLTYLKLTNLRIGLILNFNTALLKNGIKRMVL